MTKSKQIDVEEAIQIESTADLSEGLLEIQKLYGNNLPYQEERVIQEALFFKQQTLESVLAFGFRLILLKENSPHGHFMDVIKERFDLDARAAQKIMQACVKLSNASLPTHLIEAAQNKTKLFELMILDDEELDELSKGGTIVGIQLNDVQKMTTTELRAALKAAREDTEAVSGVLKKATENLEKKDIELEKIKKKRSVELTLDQERIEVQSAYKTTLNEVITTITVGTYKLEQLKSEADNDDLPPAFFKEMALAISNEQEKLDALMQTLPSHTAPIDTSWIPKTEA